MDEGEKTKERKHTGLVVVLGVLCAVAIVLALIAVVMNNHKGDIQEEVSVMDESVLPEELKKDDLSPIDQVVKTTTLMLSDSRYNLKDIEQYYDTTINDAVESGDTDLAIRVIIKKMDFLVVIEGDCRGAKEYINGVDLSPYSESEKKYLASYVISMATDCNDQDLRNQWNTIMSEGEVNTNE